MAFYDLGVPHLWLISLIALLTVLYGPSLLKRITVAIEKIAERRG